jgi:hypothetical protein
MCQLSSSKKRLFAHSIYPAVDSLSNAAANVIHRVLDVMRDLVQRYGQDPSDNYPVKSA